MFLGKFNEALFDEMRMEWNTSGMTTFDSPCLGSEVQRLNAINLLHISSTQLRYLARSRLCVRQ